MLTKGAWCAFINRVFFMTHLQCHGNSLKLEDAKGRAVH